MPRPRITKTQVRHTIRFRAEDWNHIQSLASQAGLTTSEYIRRCALQKRIRSKVHLKAIAELQRLGGLQKFCLMSIKETPALESHRVELNEVLRAILSAIEGLDDPDQGG